ncbi:MAG: hypothetical protein MSC30_14025 [Gaiellaceae bacterium MAG52_C11]|nr:hypothetical protein [Candidatus Gaiellasilicea maunaloa]
MAILLLRAGFAVAATGLVVWLLLSGLPVGALAVVVLGVVARGRAESFGRLRAGARAR